MGHPILHQSAHFRHGLAIGSGANPLVLICHGESEWNRDGRFTGWADVDLTTVGEEEARRAGRILARERWKFDVAYTSMLKRTIRSQWLMLEELDQTWVPVFHDWRLNERHCGDLTGKSKAEAIKEHGEQQVVEWLRSFRCRPPPMPLGDVRDVISDRRYRYVSPNILPRGESLRDTVIRVNGFWQEVIRPSLLAGNRIMLCAHGNSLRALVKILDGLSDYEVAQLEIPTGLPVVYWFDQEVRPTCRCYLEESTSEEVHSAKMSVDSMSGGK